MRDAHAADAHSVGRLEALLAEQSALRRVATLVATYPDPRSLFHCVCAELGGVLGVESTDMLRYEDDGTATRSWVPGRRAAARRRSPWVIGCR